MIKGWYNYRFNRFLKLFRAAQQPAPSVEVGVYQGRSFIPIYYNRTRGKPVVASDIWKPQMPYHEGGYRKIFDENCRRFLKHPEDLRIIESDSLELTAEDYLAVTGEKVRLFHIDGNHTYKGALHDMLVAEQCLTDDGVMIIDDAVHIRWPSVSQALNEFLAHAKQTDLSPVLLACGKAVLSRKRDWKLPPPSCRRPWHDRHDVPIY